MTHDPREALEAERDELIKINSCEFDGGQRAIIRWEQIDALDHKLATLTASAPNGEPAKPVGDTWAVCERCGGSCGHRVGPTSPPQAAGWNEAIEAAIDIVKPWQGAEGFARSEADKAVENIRRELVKALEALRRESLGSSGVNCANCKDPLTTSDAPLFCGCCREMGVAVPELDPWRAELSEIIGHLGSAITQSVSSDDQIIMDHVKAAHEIAKIVRRQA